MDEFCYIRLFFHVFFANLTNMNRPPVVVIMGHVDHGKTTLLDYIRKTSVALREAGGITQAIGVYEIIHNDKKITFIDTPGHEAFSNMRSHGAYVADLAILVVSAEDGVKAQTKDALSCIQAENIPFIVAINKIDKPNADIDRTKNDLGQAGVYLEGSGGNISWHAISAKTGEGVSELLDLILLAAELEDIKETHDCAGGIITSVYKDPQRGIIAGGILMSGMLALNMKIVTQSANGKIRILENFLGKRAEELFPSAPFEILGFEDLPKVGELFFADIEETRANEYLKKSTDLKPEKISSKKQRTKNESEDAIALFLKADEGASLEALQELIEKISETIPLTVASASIGDIHESDLKNAESAGAILVGFGTKTDKAAENVAYAKKIKIISSPIIYELEKSLKLYAAKVIKKEVNSIEILGIFGDQKGKQKIVGGRVVKGPIKNQTEFEIWQDKKMIGVGKILNLQLDKNDIQEADADQEVGALVETNEQIKIGNRLIFEV